MFTKKTLLTLSLLAGIWHPIHAAAAAPLPREIAIPRPQVSASHLKKLESAMSDAADPKNLSKWSGGFVHALEYWKIKGRDAFSGHYAFTSLLARGFLHGGNGFPQNSRLGNLLRTHAKAQIRHTVAEYMATHKNPGESAPFYRGSIPPEPTLPAAVPSMPPEDALAWGYKHGLPAPGSAELAATKKQQERTRFYQLLSQISAGDSVSTHDNRWVRDYELQVRGLPTGAEAPQWDEAVRTGKADAAKRAADRAAEQARIDAENKAYYAAQKAQKEIDQKLSNWNRLYNSGQKEALLSKIAQHGTESQWTTFMRKVQPYEVTQKMVNLYWGASGKGNGYTYRARLMEEAYLQNQGRRQSGGTPSGYSPSSGKGPSLYDQANQANKNFEQYQKDSYNRGGNPNYWDKRW